MLRPVDLVPRMGVAAVFAPPEGDDLEMGINTISFSDNGKNCVCSRTNGIIDLVNVECARKETQFRNPGGACHATFTHHELSVLVASVPKAIGEKAVVSYVSLHDSTVMRKFDWHTESITGISMNPVNDTFITTSSDGAFALWDLRNEVRPVMTNSTPMVGGSICSTFDPSGLVYGIANASGRVCLYAANHHGQEPFEHHHILDVTNEFVWTDMVFSDDDRFIALSCPRGVVLVDAFNLQEVALLHNHPISRVASCNAVFSIDGSICCTGGRDGHVYAYDLTDSPDPKDRNKYVYRPRMFQFGEALRGSGVDDVGVRHNQPVTAVAWHPERAMFASACTSLCLWTPPPPS